MRSCAWLVLAACGGDPSLGIEVVHPAGYAVTQTVVTAYAGDDVSCTQIEQGDRTDAELAAITVDEVDVTTGGRLEVGRLGGKSIVARGFDAQGRFVTAGCKNLGEIAGETRIEIATGPTAVVAIDPSQPDRPFAERTILVNMTDAHGAALDGSVSWQLTGPAGAIDQPASAGVQTRQGAARIHVDDLGTPGPEALRIRVPWATAPLPLVTGFDLSHATTLSLGGGLAQSHPSCDARGHAGKPQTLVCLTQANALGHRDAIELAWQADRYVVTPIAIPAGMNHQFALFVDHDGSADEPVYVLAADADGKGSWYKLGAPSATAIDFGAPLQNVVYVPKCGSASVALVGVQAGTAQASKRQLFTPAGIPVPGTAQDGEVMSGGCISDVDRTEHQAVVVAGATGDAVLTLISGAGGQPIGSARLTGVGFVTVETQGAVEKRFAGTRLQASGTVVFQSVLAPAGGSFKLVERSEVEAAAPPTKILAGKLDRDGDTDLLWDMNAGLRRRVYQVSLAKQVGGAPMTAITSGINPTALATASDFLAADLNGHGTDEMLVFTQAEVTIYTPD